MKKLLLIFAFILGAAAAKAQGVVYQPFTSNSSSSIGSQQSSTVRTNAVVERNGEYYKLPIKVAVTEAGTYSLPSIQVVAYYQYNDYSGGTWQDISPVNVSKCTGGGLYGNELEKQFLYKAYLRGELIYFDI